jgi:carbonic anhydrase
MKTPTLARTLTVSCVLAGAPIVAACNQPSPESKPPATAASPAVPPEPTTRPSTPAAGDPMWHYEGAEGPANWGMLSPKFSACAAGRVQSPIDITKTTSVASAPALKTTFAPAALRIVHHEHMADGINNGHTIQVNYSDGDTLTVRDASYQLAQYHFHAPSEHTVNGKHFPMEMHMVHKATDGKLAVVGVFIEEGQHHAAFDPVWSNLPKAKGVETHLSGVKVDVDALLPRARTTYRYDGSLTTPPCSEGVKWFVMTTPIPLSAGQIGQFTAIINGNNRPVQPINGRPIVSDAVTQITSR